MPRTLYSPRLSDDVVRALYREAKRRRMPMTRLADDLIATALAVAASAPGHTATAHGAHAGTPSRRPTAQHRAA